MSVYSNTVHLSSDLWTLTEELHRTELIRSLGKLLGGRCWGVGREEEQSNIKYLFSFPGY